MMCVRVYAYVCVWRNLERSGGGSSAEREGKGRQRGEREGRETGERTREGERHSSDEGVVKSPRLPRTRFVSFSLVFLLRLSRSYFSFLT